MWMYMHIAHYYSKGDFVVSKLSIIVTTGGT